MPKVHHYADLLKSILERRVSENSSYSLRAFARGLGISASQLSRIIARKKPLTFSAARKIAPCIFPQSYGKQEFLLELVQACNEGSSDFAMLEFICDKLLSLDSVELDEARLRCLSDWSVVAAFDAFGLARPPRSEAELAGMLGLAKREAELAIRQLEHAQLIEREGAWFKRKQSRFYTSCGIPSGVIRSLHRQMIGKALQAIEGQEISRRYLRGMALSLRPEALPRVRQVVEAFFLELEKLEQESAGQAECLYQLNLQFFDLLAPSREENKDEAA